MLSHLFASSYTGRSWTFKKGNELKSEVIIAHGGIGEGTLRFAQELERHLRFLEDKLNCRVTLSGFSDAVARLEKGDHQINDLIFIALLATNTGGTPGKNSMDGMNSLDYLWNNHRVQSGEGLHRLRKAVVVGFGDMAYGKKNFCIPAKNCVKYLSRLVGNNKPFLISPCMVDSSEPVKFGNYSNEEEFLRCLGSGLVEYLILPKTEDNLGRLPTAPSLTEESDESGESAGDDDDGAELEDMGGPMIGDRQAKVLEKQGYKLVGDHSATKLCRWTRSHLKGNGGCYKHTFYGIDSGGCMEATTSLACANKCGFCWRHHKNPVGKYWRWATDDPKVIVQGLIEKHQKLIQSLKHADSVKAERYAINNQLPRHCALSLVGEPVMYPYIQEVMDLLHEKSISTFLVTNGQFPPEMEALTCLTQLYVSIDAHNEKDLIEIDKPLFKDAWDRLMQCLNIVKNRPNWRTVYRLTLVKDQNLLRLPTDPRPANGRTSTGPNAPVIPPLSELSEEFHEEARSYNKMIYKGMPAFVEIKGFTYCGDGKGEESLTISNVPYFDEIVGFANRLLDVDDKVLREHYDIAAVHKHSMSVLVARKDYKREEDGEWLLWIDYDKFAELAERRKATGCNFSGLDYSIPAPSWTKPDAIEEGFDPLDERKMRNRKKVAGS